MKVVIIEDEARTARELSKMLLNLDNGIIIEAIIPSVEAGLKWFNENPPPALIFSDIQLGDGLSFELFRQIRMETPVIFCTAFDEYAIRAFESNSIDYLLKPVDEDMLAKSLEKFGRFKEHLIGSLGYAEQLSRTLKQLDPRFKQSLLVHYRDSIIPIKVSDIKFVYAANGLVMLYVGTDKSYTIQYTIEQLEQLLNPEDFFRANRQFIVNRNAIKNIEHYFNRKLNVLTDIVPPEKIVIGKLKSAAFLRWIEH